ncbi:hypothetical protein D3878_14570 [Noviherbaspirillum sedimenti]|uniref:Uncharacterized protein n=1 Tax=Noviherbaspirillum sedimenti TaxID=2320865 RepID=A0A3A3G2C6_9BURK|nr:hypothetical protein D3878_14570 [Noviherbaspirillum sedimenti]
MSTVVRLTHYKKIMPLQNHSKNCELVIGIVAPVGVNLDDVQNRLGSLFEQFQYKLNFIQVSKLALSYLDVEASTVIPPFLSA